MNRSHSFAPDFTLDHIGILTLGFVIHLCAFVVADHRKKHFQSHRAGSGKLFRKLRKFPHHQTVEVFLRLAVIKIAQQINELLESASVADQVAYRDHEPVLGKRELNKPFVRTSASVRSASLSAASSIFNKSRPER